MTRTYMHIIPSPTQGFQIENNPNRLVAGDYVQQLLFRVLSAPNDTYGSRQHQEEHTLGLVIVTYSISTKLLWFWENLLYYYYRVTTCAPTKKDRGYILVHIPMIPGRVDHSHILHSSFLACLSIYMFPSPSPPFVCRYLPLVLLRPCSSYLPFLPTCSFYLPAFMISLRPLFVFLFRNSFISLSFC